MRMCLALKMFDYLPGLIEVAELIELSAFD